MHALYSVEEIRRIEAAAQAGLGPGVLMQRAGRAAANAALNLIPHPRNEAEVLILAGPGNNGGDALEAAYCLSRDGILVTVVLLAAVSTPREDAREALKRAKSAGVPIIDPAFFADIAPTRWSLVIDGLFGIGLARAISGNMRTLVEYVNLLACPVLALDVPSGLDAATGDIIGDDGVAVRASHTVTFIGDKPGLHTGFGRDMAGTVSVAPLEIDAAHLPAARACLNHPDLFRHCLHARAHNSHKGSFGDVAVIGGAPGMGGAPILAARAALYCGAGRVHAAYLDAPPLYDSAHPELMCRPVKDVNLNHALIVAGPGLGTSRHAQEILESMLTSPQSLALDADALNLIAGHPPLKNKLAQRMAPSLLTPHPKEAARLLDTSVAEVQSNRPTAARRLAATLQSIVVLKGSGTVVAKPDGAIAINPTGNPGLATAGTGDVLAGVCGALLAQGLPPYEAALAAVWLHGKAADELVANGVGPIGMTASELPPAIRAALNRLIHD